MQEVYISYEDMKADVIKMGLKSRYDVICWLVALNMPIKAYAINCIERLVKEGILEDLEHSNKSALTGLLDKDTVKLYESKIREVDIE